MSPESPTSPVAIGLRGETGLSELPRGEQDVALLLRNRGETTVEELSASLCAFDAAIRASLRALMRPGFVTRSVRGRRCQRQSFYRLTLKGMRLVPVDHSELCRRLLRFVEQRRTTGSAELEDALTPWPLHGRRQFLPENDFTDQTNAIATALRDQGFLAYVRSEIVEGQQQVGTLEISQCPFIDLARLQPAICRAELKSLSEALPYGSVKRIGCMREGDAACTYLLWHRDRKTETETRRAGW